MHLQMRLFISNSIFRVYFKKTLNMRFEWKRFVDGILVMGGDWDFQGEVDRSTKGSFKNNFT